jgi:hypothetical protein
MKLMPISVAALLVPLLATVSPAALIHHYTFDAASLGADTGTVGGRTLSEQIRGSGGTVSQVTSVTDINGLTRNGVLRIKEGNVATGADADTANGSWMEHDTGASTTLANFSVALWFRTDISDNAGFSSMFSNGPTNNFQIDNGTNGVTPDDIRLLGQSGVSINDPSTFAVDTWTHLAVTYDGTDTRFYIDGSLFGTALGANAGNEFREIRLGSNRGQSRLFDGDFDEFQIHNVALDANAINAIATPEPSTSALGALGIIGWIMRRRR